MKVLWMQIRREFWEHRSLWIAPLLVSGIMLAAVATAGGIQFYQWPLRGPASPFVMMTLGWGIPLFLATAVVIVVYLIDCLYGERRDRSILFWRSLPVSDTLAVVAKLAVALLVVPLGTYLLAAITQLIAAGILRLRPAELVNGLPAPAWDTGVWLHTQARMLSGIAVLILFYSPYATYLMLASAWARRSPFAWAFLPPILLALFEYMLFGTGYIGAVVEHGLDEALKLAFNLNMQFAHNLGDRVLPSFANAPPTTGETLSAQLLSPQLWLGVLAAALMLALVIRLRRYRDDS